LGVRDFQRFGGLYPWVGLYSHVFPTQNYNTFIVPHTYYTVSTVKYTHKKEQRIPISIRVRNSVHSGVSTYCRMSGMTIGEFYELAAIAYMEKNPVDGLTIIINASDED